MLVDRYDLNPDFKDSSGDTDLHKASFSKQVAILQLLAHRFIGNVLVVNNGGKTAIDVADQETRDLPFKNF